MMSSRGNPTSPLRPHADGTLLRVHCQPRAARTEVAGIYGDAIKIRIAGPPVDGKANAELCRFLARKLAVTPAAVSLVHGTTGRRKELLIRGRTPEAIRVSLGVDV